MIKHELVRYDAYRDSGVELIGEVPEHWKVFPLKDLAAKSTGSFVDGPFGSDLKSEEYTDLGVPLIQLNNIGIGFHSTKNLKFISDEKALSLSKHRAFPGEVAIAKMADPVARATVISNLYPMYVIVADCIKFKPNSRISDKNFIAYAMNTTTVKSQAEILSNGTTRIRINLGTTKILKVVTPPLTEQKAITDYLDAKTVQIDREINLLIQKANKYCELKQSLISETVTCGLDKTITMKDTGVEWIGEVPEHWEIERIGTAFEERREIVNDTDYQPLSVTMKGIVPQLDTAAKTDHNDNRKRVSINDFVINSRSDRRGSSGVSELNGSVSVINIVLSPKKNFYGKYLHHLFRSYRFIEEFYRVGRGIVDDLWTTRYTVMKAIDFAFPNYGEQKAIADYLDTKIVHIDCIIETINTKIDKFKELRKTLTNDVVTGKIKVTLKGEQYERTPLTR